jgi:diguanylate cyclase (GGDEF)-like protein
LNGIDSNLIVPFDKSQVLPPKTEQEQTGKPRLTTMGFIKLSMILCGIIVGFAFPFFVRLFIIVRPEYELYFRISCILTGTGVGLINYLVVQRFLCKPFSRLVEITEEIATGKTDSVLPEDGNDLIGQLCRSINRMNKAINKYRNQLLILASTDPLTGALNRRSIGQALKIELSRSIRYSYDLAVFMIDLDDFKRVNDTYGHIIGDQLLRDFVSTVKNELRETDSLGRFGGDEFIILLPQTGSQEAKNVGQRLVQFIAEKDFVVSREDRQLLLKITMSMGIAIYQGDNRLDWEKLISCADEAMYQAKKQGGNSCLFYANI